MRRIGCGILARLAGRLACRSHGAYKTRQASLPAKRNTVHLSRAHEKSLGLPMKSLRKQPIARRL